MENLGEMVLLYKNSSHVHLWKNLNTPMKQCTTLRATELAPHWCSGWPGMYTIVSYQRRIQTGCHNFHLNLLWAIIYQHTSRCAYDTIVNKHQILLQCDLIVRSLWKRHCIQEPFFITIFLWCLQWCIKYINGPVKLPLQNPGSITEYYTTAVRALWVRLLWLLWL